MMANSIGSEAAKPNPMLEAISPFLGTWNTVGTHPLVPGTTFHGRTSFAWIEGGAFLMMRTEIDEPGIPSGISIFGTDDETGECSMLYFDERGVSRRYEVLLRDRAFDWSRNTPDFSQRFSATLSADGRSIVVRGEMSRQSGEWEPDLELTCTRSS